MLTRRRLLHAVPGALLGQKLGVGRPLRRGSAAEEPVAQRLFGLATIASPADGLVAINDRIELTGRAPDIIHWFQPWELRPSDHDKYAAISMTPEARLDWLQAVRASGAIPLISWEAWNPADGRQQSGFNYASILDGAHDAYLNQWFRAISEHAGPVYVRLFHEFNTPDLYPWSLGANGNDPASHVAAWRYVVRRAWEVGATNIAWVWCPNTGVIPAEAYPGDLYLSVVGLDTYNAPVPEWGGWRWFADIIGGNYDAIRAIAPEMPLWLCETACSEDGGDKADWIRYGPSREVLDEWFPRVAAVVWFDVRKNFDWRIDSSSDALAAFREVIQSQ